MREVNVTELRSHLPKYLSKAQSGTEILVTSHGQVIARIMPPVNTQEEAKQQLKQLRKNAIIGDVISPIDETWDADQ